MYITRTVSSISINNSIMTLLAQQAILLCSELSGDQIVYHLRENLWFINLFLVEVIVSDFQLSVIIHILHVLSSGLSNSIVKNIKKNTDQQLKEFCASFYHRLLRKKLLIYSVGGPNSNAIFKCQNSQNMNVARCHGGSFNFSPNHLDRCSDWKSLSGMLMFRVI